MVLDESHDLDYVFHRIVGGGGRWQWTRFLFLMLTFFPLGLPLLLHLFTAYTPKHRCFVPGCDTESSKLHGEQFLEFSTPKDHGASNFFSDSVDYDPCLMFEKSVSETSSCTPSDFQNTSLVKCVDFVYDQSEFVSTLTTEFNLVCDNVDRRHLLGSIMMLGLTFGSFLGGPIGDRFGRKSALFGGMCIAVPSVLLGSITNDYWTYLILRLTACTCIVFGWIAGHNFQVEYFDKEHRRLAYAVSSMVGHTLGLSLPLIIYLCPRDWRDMHLWVGMFCMVGFPAFFFLPESPRWLISNKREKEAEKIFFDIAKGNGRVLDEKQEQEVRHIVRQLAQAAQKRERLQKLSIKHLFGSRLRSRTLILFLCWVCTMVTLYALVLNVEALSGDIFLNYVLGAIMELPGHLLVYLAVDRLGRRRLLFSLLMLLGLTCLAMALLPKSIYSLVLATYCIGKFASAGCASLVWLYTSELYPTNLRSQAMGMCSMMGRIFGLSSSFISELAKLWPPLPMMLLAIPAIIASLLSLKLPETTGRPLPETIEEAFALNSFELKPVSSAEKTLLDVNEDEIGLIEDFLTSEDNNDGDVLKL